MDVDEVIESLYGLSPARFTAARDEAAARVKAEGDPAGAKRIAGQRRPTLAAWASNMLVRAKPDEVGQFLQLGQALRTAHRSLDGDQLRDLSHQQHVVIGALAREAHRLAEEAGTPVSEGVVREVERILHAVLADPEAAESWASGRLAKAPALTAQFPAVDAGAAAPVAPAKPAPPVAPAPDAGPEAPAPEPYDDGRLEEARAAAQDAARSAQAREDELRLADEVRQRAVAEAAAARAAVTEAEERYREAGRAARQARLATAAAERRVKEVSADGKQGSGGG
ncbi:hypothetical protein [Streptomyces sp. ISL-86]|uniref:hypothetical protein n=1 Tax=Streptomyces sp. ISL-86 TaxID=2819187 RepID=UPI001BEBFF88|nr:hypothetical protein [Streptomyces sp. ISL-86]MBT2458806.1 hypothetical protein [Streptomyces sp. ISL-86]